MALSAGWGAHKPSPRPTLSPSPLPSLWDSRPRSGSLVSLAPSACSTGQVNISTCAQTRPSRQAPALGGLEVFLVPKRAQCMTETGPGMTLGF